MPLRESARYNNPVSQIERDRAIAAEDANAEPDPPQHCANLTSGIELEMMGFVRAPVMQADAPESYYVPGQDIASAVLDTLDQDRPVAADAAARACTRRGPRRFEKVKHQNSAGAKRTVGAREKRLEAGTAV
jgi:hypothetical protein